MNFRLLAASLAAFSITLLAGCGGSGDDDGSGHVRLLNVSSDFTSLDLYYATSDTADSRISSAVAQDTVGDYVTLSATTHTFKLKRADTSTTSLSTDRSMSNDVYNTLVAYSTGGTLRTSYMTDSETAPTSGTGKLRVFNTSTEAGSVDIYVTSVGGSLTDVSATASSIAGERYSSYSEIGKGSYRVVVTGAGDKTDIRLDIPSLTLADQQITTLILTSTPGGVLVHGTLINQQSGVTTAKNSSARMRVVAGTTANGSVAATVNGTILSSGLTSPTVSAYVLVPAGALTTDIKVNGSAVSTSGLTATAGADLTLMVLGTPSAPSVTLLSDNNAPSTTTSNSKIRLFHGVNNLSGSATLTVNYAAVATNVGFGSASESTSYAAGTDYRLEVTSPVSAGSLYLDTAVTLQAAHVYTVFMLGESSAPRGFLLRDR